MTITSSPEIKTESLITPKKTHPILWWAGLGAAFVALWWYIWISWIVKGEAKATPTGPDPVPTSVKAWVWLFTIASVGMAIWIIAHAVKSSRREGRLSFDAILMIGWFSCWWQDAMANYVRPTYFYNTYFINLGSWNERIPGWVSPNGSHTPEPLVFAGAAYFWMAGVAFLFCALLRRVRARWPQMSTPTLVFVGFLSVALFDLVLEVAMVRTRVSAYAGTIHGLSIFGGKWYQFPIYNSIYAGALFTASGVLRYFRDDKGNSFVERGLERLKITRRQQTGLRILAVCGFTNLALLVTYFIPYNWTVLHVDRTPEYPSWLRAGICGPGTGYECPNPISAIPLPQTPPAQ